MIEPRPEARDVLVGCSSPLSDSASLMAEVASEDSSAADDVSARSMLSSLRPLAYFGTAR